MLAIFATLFGSAASLGLGALQIRSGLHIVGGLSETGNMVLVVIITVLTVAFVLSAVSGVARGIQWLSNINMVLAIGACACSYSWSAQRFSSSTCFRPSLGQLLRRPRR